MSGMEALAKLFGSSARVKILRLFLLHPDEIFETADVRTRSKVSAGTVRSELSRLYGAGVLYQKSFSRELKTKTKKGTPRKKTVWGFAVDPEFPYLDALRALVLANQSFNRHDIVSRIRGVGQVKLLVLSGIFVEDEARRVDLLVVGDNLKPQLVSQTLKTLESEIGCELRYASFATDDFLYRMDLYDKFLRDIFDYPHEKLINKLTM